MREYVDSPVFLHEYFVSVVATGSAQNPESALVCLKLRRTRLVMVRPSTRLRHAPAPSSTCDSVPGSDSELECERRSSTRSRRCLGRQLVRARQQANTAKQARAGTLALSLPLHGGIGSLAVCGAETA